MIGTPYNPRVMDLALKPRPILFFQSTRSSHDPIARRYDVSPLDWNSAASHFAAFTRRHRRFGSRGISVHRLSCQREAGALAGAAAESPGQWKFSVLIYLSVCRESPADQPGAIGRGELAQPERPFEPHRRRSTHRLRAGESRETAAGSSGGG